MHSNARIMLRKLADTVPFGSGALLIFPFKKRRVGIQNQTTLVISQNTNLSINLFINQINSL